MSGSQASGVLVGGSVEISIIQVLVASDRLRPCSEEQVQSLMESITEVGLINPISVFAERAKDGILFNNGYHLVAGLNRLEACKRLGWKTIPAVMLALDELHRQLVEVDENLCGSKLTPAERALFTRRRKDIYLALHPETRLGAVGNGRGKVRKNCESTSPNENNEVVERFTESTAKSTGQSERTVQIDASRGEALGDAVLAEVRGTSLDKGTELDALKTLPPAERTPLVERAKSGEKVSARREKTADQLDEDAALEAFAEALLTRFKRTEYPLLLDWCRTLKLTRLRKQLEAIGVGAPPQKKEKKKPGRNKSAGSAADASQTGGVA
ncbi:MAG: ParB N-terminal domain-containing protein [Rhodospirillaceae bacterium]